MVDRTGSTRPGLRPAARVNSETQDWLFPVGASGAAADRIRKLNRRGPDLHNQERLLDF